MSNIKPWKTFLNAAVNTHFYDECTQIDLYEFLTESELQQYYNAIKNELKITNAAQFKYATDEDLRHIGLSRPEIRRLRKFCEKHFPHGYLSKIKRLLQAPTTIVRREDGLGFVTNTVTEPSASTVDGKNGASPSKAPNNKHIIPADSISVNKQLGTGEFGIVQQGVWTNGTERIQVAIKCLCRERMQSNPMEFLKEAAIMHSIEHENIVRLYGVVLATDSLMLVTELAHLRSLLECLKDSGLRVSFLTIPTLCEFAVQICNGMKYLEQKRLIHRDLAARNILVFSKNKVKISDFGLSRALGVGKDYYKTNFNVNLKLPIAWCAPECINYLRFTNASDVWAFGVCLWEMFSYGFQPWAALTGLQILEAIDAPNYQRLEQPDCCPSEYYTLMMKCWQDDPTKRPKFYEIYEQLPDMKPEQLKAVGNCIEPKKEHLMYRQGEIITVLDRNTGTPFWKGVLSTGKTGYFNPSNTVAFLEGLPSSNRDSFSRASDHRSSSKRKLRTEMISKPQNDFKHTGHVGIDGASFGDIAFLGSSQNYNHVPRQIVTPYKPSEDIEQTPLLLPPTPTSPDSLQTASGYFHESLNATTSMNPTFISSNENTPKQLASSFNYPEQRISYNASTNPFAHKSEEEQFAFALQNNNYGLDGKNVNSREAAGEASWLMTSRTNPEDPHEYHEISDDEITADKLDLGPSLLDEINSMFGSISVGSVGQPKSPEFEQVNMKNEFTEITSKLSSKNNESAGHKTGLISSSSKKKTAGTVKPISVKDEKILNYAIEIANEISARSMIDLVSDHPPATQSPKRKFSFRFPHLSNSVDKSNGNGSPVASGSGLSNAHHGTTSPYAKKKNFTEELRSIPDLQTIIRKEGRDAYNSLIERKGSIGVNIGLSPAATLLHDLDTDEFEMTSAKTLPRRSVHLSNGGSGGAGLRTPSPKHCAEPIDLDRIVAVPVQHAPRPMTLPTRGATQRVRRAELANLSKQNGESGDAVAAADINSPKVENAIELGPEACESPSYMTHNAYKFPEKAETNDGPGVSLPADTNVIPLPPREGKKQVKTNAKRHVRKHPLILAGKGLQRTMNKVLDSDDEHRTQPTPNGGINSARIVSKTIEISPAVHENVIKQAQQQQQQSPPQKAVSYENMPAINSNTATKTVWLTNRRESDAHSYQNLDKLGPADAAGLTDSASLQFESILEADSNKCNVLQSPDVTDGFYNFSIQKEDYNKGKEVEFDANKMSGLYVNEDELRNLDIDRNLQLSLNTLNSITTTPPPAATATTPSPGTEQTKPPTATIAINTPEACQESPVKCPNADNELAGNALFKKVRESVNMAMNKSGQRPVPEVAPPAEPSNTQKPSTTSASSVGVGVGVAVKQQTEAEYFAAKAASLANSNSVSCEDLLEFADKKPKGCERGVDSDEVRIMTKVLGKDSVPTRCLSALEFINWDVHKAIKLIKLQNILADSALSLSAAYDALDTHEWDLHMTSLKLKGIKP